MTKNKELIRMHKSTMVNENGELIVNAGRFARGATIMAFEMMGGIENFVQWAENNETEFYTKMFGKVIGREVENKNSDSVESLLKILDGEAEDVTPEPVVKTIPPHVQEPTKMKPSMRDRLNKSAEKYFASEALT